MKRSTGILLLLLVGFALGAIYFLTQQEKVNSGTDFAFKNTKAIYKMTLSHPNGTNIQLNKDGEDWLIGDKPARKEAVSLLLETLQKLHIRSRVPKAAVKNIKKSLKEQGITLKTYNKSGNHLKTWIVGAGSQGNLGTYMMLGDGTIPFDIDILGWDGQLRPRFLIDEEAWRNRNVFEYNSKEIKSVSIQYFSEKNKNLSFKIDKESKNKYAVAPLNHQEKSLKEPVQAKVLHYLKGYSSITAENFVNNLPLRDSILQTTPFCHIRLELDNGNTKEVKLFPIPTKTEKLSKDGAIISSEVERYYASVNDNEDFMLVQHRVFYKLVPPYGYFFEK